MFVKHANVTDCMTDATGATTMTTGHVLCALLDHLVGCDLDR